MYFQWRLSETKRMGHAPFMVTLKKGAFPLRMTTAYCMVIRNAT